MERKIEFSIDEYYHIYNRGVDKRKIFLGPRDYWRFLVLLYLANTTNSVHFGNLRYLYRGEPLIKIFEYERGDEPLVAIGAHCLMPNHFHLLLKEVVEGGISKFMLKLQTAYSMYFNLKNERSGALFQGIFKGEHADDDDYLKYLFAYIHLNPAKLIDSKWREKILSGKEIARLEDHIESYPYSSYALYLGGGGPEKVILERREFPEDFQFPCELRSEMFDWLNYTTENL